MRTMMARVATTLGVAASLALGVVPSNAVTPEAIFRDARNYTVRIRSQVTTPFYEDERGSFTGAGFVIDAGRRWVVTNAHVVTQSPADLQVAFADEEFRPARKIYVDSFTDMAVIEVEATGRPMPTPLVDCKNTPPVGEAVAAFGHPLDMPFTGTRGIVSGHTDKFLNDLIQMDATIDHGNSGGPVISLRDGRIVGIATAGASDEDSKQMNLATPMSDVCKIVDLLRQGRSPEPPHMEFSLLVDEDDRHTLQVARTHDSARWPFLPGDLIVSVGPERQSVSTVSTLVSALRGRQPTVPIQVLREGKTVVVSAKPRWRPSIIARRGLVIDGALVAPYWLEDDALLRDSKLIIHSVEPGSTAEALGVKVLDILISVDGRDFGDIDRLHDYLNQREDHEPVRLVFQRVNPSNRRWWEFHIRELPVEEFRIIGPDNLAANAPTE